LSCDAAASPAGPEPTTATRRPVREAGGRGCTQPSAKARSMISFSSSSMVTASMAGLARDLASGSSAGASSRLFASSTLRLRGS